MATKFVIEVEEGETKCAECPFNGCHCAVKPINKFNCNLYNLATMKVQECKTLQFKMTMCTGRGCNRRATCLRAVLYNKWRKKKTSKPQAVTMLEVTEKCDKYIERVTINGVAYEPVDTPVEILRGMQGDCKGCDIFKEGAPYRAGNYPACCDAPHDKGTIEDKCVELLFNERINRIYKRVETE